MERIQLDTGEYISVLRELVEQGKEVSVLISGTSMTPFLGHNRDVIFFSRPTTPLARGDMVFYQRADGTFVMHRILKVRPEGLYIVGDAQALVEGPVPPSSVFARVTKARRKGKLIEKGDFLWDFFAGPWLTLRPLRPLIMSVYAKIK